MVLTISFTSGTLYSKQQCYFIFFNDAVVHLHFKRYPIKDIPFNGNNISQPTPLLNPVHIISSSPPSAEIINTEFKKWLFARFMEKDNLMQQFVDTGHFPVGEMGKERVVELGSREKGFWSCISEERGLFKIWAIYWVLLILWLLK